MELFRKDGHLSEEGLKALVDENLDELQRLETAEHLSFCDACLVRYTDLLETQALQSPEQPLEARVLRRRRRQALRVAWGKYATVAAAAVLAVAIWAAGTIGLQQASEARLPDTTAPASVTQPPANAEDRLGNRLDNAVNKAGSALTDLFTHYPAPASQSSPAASNAQTQKDVFEKPAMPDPKPVQAGQTNSNAEDDSSGQTGKA